jgi:hypothetical protein
MLGFEYIVDVMPAELFSRIVDWNKKRNGLEFNPELEEALIQEEVTEFKEAEEIVDILDAYLDTVFVLVGSVAKSTLNLGKVGDADRYEWGYGPVDEFVFKGMATFSVMTRYLSGKLREYGIPTYYHSEVIVKGLEIVTEANEKKGAQKAANGKIKKPKSFQPPEKKLEKMLKDIKYKAEEELNELEKGGVSPDLDYTTIAGL